MDRPQGTTDYSKDPPVWLRFLIGVVGSTVTVAPPFGSRLLNADLTANDQVWGFALGTGALLGCAWLMSVIITTAMKEDHLMKCVLTSMAIPGFVVSMTTVTQFVK